MNGMKGKGKKKGKSKLVCTYILRGDMAYSKYLVYPVHEFEEKSTAYDTCER